jgi:cysteinyl-tRNA synthetase
MSSNISQIDRLVRSGVAYAVEVPPMGTFVCLDFAKLQQRDPHHAELVERLEPPPVEYDIVPARTRRDYALWAPWCEGAASPWGRGLVTVNCEYLRLGEIDAQ